MILLFNSPGDHRTMSVRFEPVNYNLLDVHGAATILLLLPLLLAIYYYCCRSTPRGAAFAPDACLCSFGLLLLLLVWLSCSFVVCASVFCVVDGAVNNGFQYDTNSSIETKEFENVEC